MSQPTRKTDPVARFREKVEFRGDDECWEWGGAIGNGGYGRIAVNGKMVLVHRFSYEMVNGDIPSGLCIDHLCRNRGCVNPKHMEVVTRAENTRRGFAPGIVAHRNGVCMKGIHSIDGRNAISVRGGKRCRACHNEYQRRRCAERRIKRLAESPVKDRYDGIDWSRSVTDIAIDVGVENQSVIAAARKRGVRPVFSSRLLPSRINWESVDWGLSNKEISAIYGITRQWAGKMRKRYQEVSNG